MTTKRTALVTGASGGIGLELAKLLAKDHHDLVLVARSEARLEEIAKSLSEAHGIVARVVASDLGQPGAPDSIFERLREQGVVIDILVNNAGFGSNGAFLDLALEPEVAMVDLNVRALVKLTHLFARGMRDRRFGRVLNIASTAGFQPGPFMATYFASKAFVVSFSEALAYELAGTGVTVTCHCPGPTETGFTARAGSGHSKLFVERKVASAEEVAADAYRAMLSGNVLAVHGAFHWLQMQALRFAPRALVRRVAADLNRSP